ncbi:unnamed protein product [Macrosiphum euphorbiae]|uniref:MULE transposase domain-containing protein n=1 Tax=Macrosiphum euphorbiae TaxID=13131 RepID=A0AAV0Y1R1_9HEMI|nr:unnamed protein product [Macrosiphum euphorbiae]
MNNSIDLDVLMLHSLEDVYNVHYVDGRSNVIFACTNLLQHILRNVVTDETFKVVPVNMGYQLLTIHCMIQNYYIPIVYFLMESKSRNLCDCVIRFIRNNLWPNVVPETIITGYETALRDELISPFSKSSAVGCFFHHNQAVWRKMKNLSY